MLLKSGDETVVTKAGDILFYRSGFVHDETSDPTSPACLFFIRFDTGDLLPALPLLMHDAYGRVGQLISWLVEDEQTQRAPEMRRLHLDTILGELRRLCEAPPDAWLEDIVSYIRKNMMQTLTLDLLARRGKMSKFAFIRKFKRLCGRTPMEEVRHMRLHQAKTLLLTTNMPVKAIAPAVGIGDEYQLSNLFRFHFNISPRNFRAQSISMLHP